MRACFSSSTAAASISVAASTNNRFRIKAPADVMTGPPIRLATVAAISGRFIRETTEKFLTTQAPFAKALYGNCSGGTTRSDLIFAAPN
jgi:hypothetical protein